jgi:hypothetical protein
MGYDYEIEYRKGKDNVAADALSRTSSQLLYSLVASSVSTKLMEEIAQSWQKDPHLQTVIQNLQVSLTSHSHYTWVNGHLQKKGKIVVGRDVDLHRRLISFYRNLAVGSHSGSTTTVKRVGSLFYWKGQQKHV